MKQMRGILLVAMAVMLLAMMGCGPGSNQSGTLALSTSAATVNAGDTASATATYTPADSSKNPIGLVISFSTDRPDIVAFSSTSMGVGTDGTATASFRTLSVASDTKVNIIAQTGGLTQSVQVTVKATSGGTVTPPSVTATPQSITFVSASPTQINLKGFGTSTNPETSLVTFMVKDTAGSALSGVTVDFTLSTTVGGITITPASAVSNSSGQVTTIVTSGTMVTPVRVTATVHGSSPAITSQSAQLVIAGGPPDQSHLSISLSNFTPEAWSIDGKTVSVTARLADHFGNPVSDGTAVYFTTNGGSIQSACTTSGGACSVTWTSQNPRPTTPGVNEGTVAILAFAVGEESFTDLNNNSIADGGACTPITWLPGVGTQAFQCGEFTDTPDAYRDDNFNGQRDANEPFYNLTGATSYGFADGLYEGSFLAATSTNPRSKYIFYNSALIMSSSSPGNVSLATTTVPFGSAFSDPLTVTDVNGNPMPSGTTIAATVVAGATSACLKINPTSITVPNSLTATAFNMQVTNTCSSSTGARDSITFTVTSPSGLVTTWPIQMSY